MAAVNKGSVSVTATISSRFGHDSGSNLPSPRDIVIQNVGENSAFIHWDQDGAEVDKGLRVAAGESVSTVQLPAVWRGSMNKGLTAICDTGETTTILWSA